MAKIQSPFVFGRFLAPLGLLAFLGSATTIASIAGILACVIGLFASPANWGRFVVAGICLYMSHADGALTGAYATGRYPPYPFAPGLAIHAVFCVFQWWAMAVVAVFMPASDWTWLLVVGLLWLVLWPVNRFILRAA
jgi:hypothetical protein